jgi:hypothetical protein
MLLQAARDDADDAGVPAVLGGPDERGVEPACLGLRQGRFAHAGLDLAPVGVERVEPPASASASSGVIGGQKARAEVGLTDPAAGIDAGPRTKPR